MTWRIELSELAVRELSKLDSQHSKRILKYLKDRIAKLDDPRSLGKALQGSQFGELWRYRLGDFRIICKIEDQKLVVVVVRIGHRKEIYR
jgi:mRNA interferase RelE/StbE